MTPGIIKKLYHTTPVGLTDEDKQEVYPITATSAVYSAPGESSFPDMPLNDILDALNEGYQYLGKATPSTNPGTYNHKVFYIASEAGTYSHFDGITVSGLTVLKNSGNGWSADAFNIVGGGGGGLTVAYIGTTMVQETPGPQQLSGISQLNLTTGARIYFGETAYIELNQYGFHFSEGIYSDSFVAAGGIGTGSGGGGGGYVLPVASESTLGGIKVGSGLYIDGSGVLSVVGGGGEGSVTSVGLTVPTGFSVAGSPITSSGTIVISFASGYSLPSDSKQATWDSKQNSISDLSTIRSNAAHGETAYGWGNHANAGYALNSDLLALGSRVTSIESWFEIVTVNGQQALHAKSGRAIYSDSWIAAGGIGSGSGGGGTDLNRVWESLTNNTDKPNVKINVAHIPDLSSTYLTSHQTIYALNLSAGSFTAGTYTPNSAAGSFNIPTTLDHLADGTTRKLSDYVTIAGGQTITGAKTFSAWLTASEGIITGGDIYPSTDLGGSLGYGNRRFANGNIQTIGTSTIYLKNSSAGNSGLLSASGGYLVIRAGSDVTTSGSYKQLNFHASYGFYPDGTGVNLGYSGANNRWATIYGVDGNLTGDLTLASTSHIDIGPLRIEYDDSNKAIHITKISSSDNNTYGLYADGFIAAGGIGQTS